MAPGSTWMKEPMRAGLFRLPQLAARPRPFPPRLPTRTSSAFHPTTSLLVDSSVGSAAEFPIFALPPLSNSSPLADIVGQGASWSPDGRHLVFFNASDIFQANADGTDAKKLITVSGTPRAPAFSPDGARIRFDIIVPENSSTRSGKCAPMAAIFILASSRTQPTS